MFSTAYRRYNQNAPKFLHDRPPQFVKHCLKSRFAAAEYKSSDVMAVNFRKGKFNVKSQTSEGNKHLVDFSTPACCCEARRKTQYPCKHFFAVFSAYKKWSFDSLPDAYRNSVFITLDNEHLKIPAQDYSNLSSTTMKTSSPRKEPQKDSVDTSPDTDRTDKNNLLELDTGVQSLSSENFKVQNSVKLSENISKNQVILKLRKVLHEKLDALKNISYIADTEIALKNAIEGIEEIQRRLVSSCPQQNGIPLRNSPAKKKLKITKNEYHQVFHKKLPKRKKMEEKSFTSQVFN